MIYLLASYIIVIILDARDDYNRISRGEWIDHKEDTFLISILYLMITFGAFVLFSLSAQEVLRALIMLPSTRWLLHDLLLNHWRGLPVGYTGVGDGDKDASTDKLLSKIPLHPLWIKGAFWVGSMALSFFAA